MSNPSPIEDTSLSAISFIAQGITKRYGFKPLFSNISFSLQRGERLALAGRNGSGKTTLLKILSGLMRPSEGTTQLTFDGIILERESYFKHSGFAGPYLTFYDELTGLENIQFALGQSIKKTHQEQFEIIEHLFQTLNLWHARDAMLKTYSSGMIQRLRLIQAFARPAKLLFLDEPTATLDTDGKARFEKLLEDTAPHVISLIASNDPDEISLCQKKLQITDFYRKPLEDTTPQK
ncbi:MAG: ABC transporter ATP-binding protein [Chloroherpetonaceae bacterium]|nr:ABC transporter ATP-binding protein [Chloroherpetonaceae bacterium]